MTIHLVSNSNELNAALSKAGSGDTILMEAGNYGSLDLSGQQYTSTVTLKSADADNPAIVQKIEFESSSYIRIDGLKVLKGSETGARLIDVKSSDNIEIINSEIDGGTPTGSTYGIYSKDVDGLTISNSYIHDVGNGMAVFSTADIVIDENLVDYVFSDFFKFGGVSNMLFENNTGGGNLFPDADAHADFVQFQGSANDVVLRGNLFLAQNNERAQGLFLSDATYTNILIEQNIIYSGKVRAISVVDGSGIVVRDNTLLTPPDAGHPAASIIVPDGSVVENNITSAATGSQSGSNVVAQYTSEGANYYYNDLFGNANVGLGVTLEDLRPVPGSLAETIGAYDRLMELLDGTNISIRSEVVENEVEELEGLIAPPPVPVEESKVTDPADPIVAPAPLEQGSLAINAAYNLAGSFEFTNISDVIEISPRSSLLLEAATIRLSFNADSVAGNHGIISKDASGFGNGGNHFTSYIKDGQLFVRFQDGETSEFISTGNIRADQDYDLQISFGEGSVAVWLDDVKIGQKSFDTSWVTNEEFLQVGANGWGSTPGERGFRDVFDGTISDVLIVEGAHTPVELAESDVGSPQAPAPVVDTLPADDGYATVFELSGSMEFSGKRKSVLKIDHDSDLEISEGTIAFSFESDDVNSRDGLVSKDGSGYSRSGEGGNHFSSWIDGGNLYVRFQATESEGEAAFVFRNLENDTSYDLQAYFDGDSVGLLVNGQFVDEQALKFDLAGNNESLQVGGLGWSSTPDGDLLSNPFDGTISNVIIIDEAVMIPLDIA